MTVKELKEELDCYDEDAEVVFEVDDEFEPESISIVTGLTVDFINGMMEGAG